MTFLLMKCGDITMSEKKDSHSFCFKKAGGLKLVNPNERLLEVYKKNPEKDFAVFLYRMTLHDSQD